MNRFSLSSLRVRLALLVLLAVIPSLGLIYYNARQQRAAAVTRARDDVERIAHLTATLNTRIIDGARQLLVSFSYLAEVRGGDPSLCSATLQKLLSEYLFYSNLGVAMPDGTVNCSAVPLTEPVSVANSVWFQQALKTRDFAVGASVGGALSAYPTLNCAYPMTTSGDRTPHVLFASLDLAYLTRQMAFLLPTENTELVVVDHDGIVLGETGSKESRIGRTVPEATQIKGVSSQRGRGADQWFDAAGTERIYAFYPIGGKRAGVDLYVIASMPTATAFADADRQLRKNLIALAVVALVALAAAWYGGEAIVLRRANDELEQRVQERTKALEHEQFLLRTLLDNVPDSIYFKDAQGHFLRSSRAQAKRFGLDDSAEAIGKTDFDFFKKEHAAEAFADEQQIIRTGQPLIDIEEHSPLADGTERWVSTSKLPLRDKQGNIVGTFGISREITEHKRAEQALAKERNVLRTLVDNVPDLVFVKDQKGRYVFNNASHRAFLGVSSLDDVLGKTVFDFYPKELATRLHTDDEAVLAAGMPVLNREEELTDRNGRKLRAVTSKIPYRDEEHKIVGLVCVSRQLSELK